MDTKSSTLKKAEPKKKAESEKKQVKKAETKIKLEKKELNEDSLKNQFEEETGKKAVWRGKETHAYIEWKEQKEIK